MTMEDTRLPERWSDSTASIQLSDPGRYLQTCRLMWSNIH